MASFIQVLPLFLSGLFLFGKIILAQSSSLVLLVTKDDSTSQYLVTLSYGTPISPTKLVLNLGGQSLLLDCASKEALSSSIETVPRRSIQCLAAKTHEIETSKASNGGQKCLTFPENSITGEITGEGNIVQDLMAIQQSKIRLLFTCSTALLLNGPRSGPKGIVGLGGTRASPASQIFSSFNAQRKF